jgi:cyclopropane-fatty-acyl-phospholipid synthase
VSIIAAATKAFEAAPLPDALSRLAIRALVANGARNASSPPDGAALAFAHAMRSRPIATDPTAANRQHYEVPSDFFRLVLGPQRKYSCCYFETSAMTLGEAEERALQMTALNADLGDGQRILELGCGWGSLTLWMARRYPKASIVAVSNSSTQRAHIEAELNRLGLHNATVITADMNEFQTHRRFDRIVSVEMFEHMSNWHVLLERVRGWLEDDGKALIHVFAHKSTPYAFDAADASDWIAHHFFTGGIMPSQHLIHQFPELFEVEREWRWSGTHYARTAEHWLQNFDTNRDRIRQVLQPVYGDDVNLWMRRWRLFFLATAELFGHDNGNVWSVCHYRMRRT